MKRAAILLMVLVLVVSLGLYSLDTLNTPAPHYGVILIISSLPMAHAVYRAPSLPETILGSRSDLTGAVSTREFTRTLGVARSLPVRICTLRTTGFRQVLLARIRD